MTVNVIGQDRIYKYCVVNEVAGLILFCASKTEAEELAAAKRKHDLHQVKGLPKASPLAEAAQRRARSYCLAAVVLLV
jgi:hypothetical protein